MGAVGAKGISGADVTFPRFSEGISCDDVTFARYL